MAATTNGSLVEDYRVGLAGFKIFDAERVALVNGQRDASSPPLSLKCLQTLVPRHSLTS